MKLSKSRAWTFHTYIEENFMQSSKPNVKNRDKLENVRGDAWSGVQLYQDCMKRSRYDTLRKKDSGYVSRRAGKEREEKAP